MSIFTPKPGNPVTDTTTSRQPSPEILRYQKEITDLKDKIKELERELLRVDVKKDYGFVLAEKTRQHAASVEERNQWLEERNTRLENPKGSHYSSLSWPGKIIFCIKKMRRPLRFQEIMQELLIMERLHKTEAWLTEKTISVTLSGMAKDKRLHSEKMRGTRGNFYALTEWLNESGELDEKMKRKMW